MHPQVRELLDRIQSVPDFCYVTFDSINATNALGDNALHCVCVWGDLAAAKLLVENGINVNHKGEHGLTPLKVAEEFGFPRIVEYLLSNGADPKGLDAVAEFDREADLRHSESLQARMARLEEYLANCPAPAGARGDA